MNFELSRKKRKNGKRKFTAVLYKLQPDNCVIDKTGTEFNANGITWIEKYCRSQLSSISDMSVTVEFIDDERVEILGHGDTGQKDGIPIFEKATTIGHFTKGFIDEVDFNGEIVKCVCGSGYIDEMRYKSFVENLEVKLANGYTVCGSIEIIAPDDKDGIVYLDGWKPKGRIPIEFQHSGWAILGVQPADKYSKLLEMNKKTNEEHKERKNKGMDDKIILEQLKELNERLNEVEELKAKLKSKTQKISELEKVLSEVEEELKKVREEREAKCSEIDLLYREKEEILNTLAKEKLKTRISEIDDELKIFTDEQKSVVSKEIEQYKSDVNCEINIESIKQKIFAHIGEQKVLETNSKHETEHELEIYGNVDIEHKNDSPVVLY